MDTRHPPQIDMTLDGQFVPPPRPGRSGSPLSMVPLGYRVAAVAILVGFVAAGMSLAALVLWAALSLLPVVAGAALVAWAAIRFQRWRSGVAAARMRSVAPNAAPPYGAWRPRP